MGSLLKLRGPKRLIAESPQEPQSPEEHTVQPQSGRTALTSLEANGTQWETFRAAAYNPAQLRGCRAMPRKVGVP